MGFKEKAQIWFRPVVLSVAVAVCTVTAAVLYDRTESRYLEARSRQIADGIARHLQAAIQNRTAVLRILGHSAEAVNTAEFDKMAGALMSEYSGFYAINMVSAAGVIAKVYPQEANRRALGQNLLEREDVREYLLAAKERREPRMSHKLLTFQQIPAFTLYVPLYSGTGAFFGWLNAVVDLDGWLAEFMRMSSLDRARIRVRWDHPDSDHVDRGVKAVKDFFTYRHRLLNQDLILEIGFAPDDLDAARTRYSMLILVVGSALLLFALFQILGLHFSKLRLRRANEVLALKNNLLSSLCHDLSGPLSILNLSLERVLESDEPLPEKKKRSVSRALETLAEMLKSVRLLHAHDLGVRPFRTEPVGLSFAVQAAAEAVQPQAEAKKIALQVSAPAEAMRVLAEPSTLKNNVLLNALTNAIKFSPEGGTVRVSASVDAEEARLIVEDEGEGLSEKQLADLRKSLFLQSTQGTAGEAGTGLGLLQIQGFMKAYGGRMEIENRAPKGCRMILIFRKS